MKQGIPEGQGLRVSFHGGVAVPGALILFKPSQHTQVVHVFRGFPPQPAIALLKTCVILRALLIELSALGLVSSSCPKAVAVRGAPQTRSSSAKRDAVVPPNNQPPPFQFWKKQAIGQKQSWAPKGAVTKNKTS